MTACTYRRPWCQAVAQMLTDVREAAGLSQRMLAAALDVDHRTIRRIEDGLTTPRGAFVEAWLAQCAASAAIVAWRTAA